MQLFHQAPRLSIRCLAAAAVLVATPALAGAPVWEGRWTVNEDKPVFTAKGRLYQTVDIAPCGKDLCGVSVGNGGQCAATLFRIPGRKPDNEEMLRGRGKWGASALNLVAYTWEDAEVAGGKVVDLYLGKGYNFGERSGSMPKYHSAYRRTGAARCTVR